MIEEFDAIQRLNIPQFFLTAGGYLLAGIVLEIAIRLGRRLTSIHHSLWIAAILGALTWQPLVWGLLLGAVSPLLLIIQSITDWQRGSDLVNVLILASTTIVVVRLINGLLQLQTARIPSASVSLLNNLLTGAGLLIVTTIVLGYLFNISVQVLLLTVVGGLTGLTVIFQEPIKNLVGGISLTLSQRLNPGDWVKLPSGIEGCVVDIQWDVTVVRQLTNNTIIVPNATMTAAEIINYNRPDPVMVVLIPVGVSYNSDLARVEEVTLEEAGQIMQELNGDAVTDRLPVIRYNAFAESSINFNVVLYAPTYVDQFVLRHEFIKRLHRRYEGEGIVIPFPIRTLHTPQMAPIAVVQNDVCGSDHRLAATEGD